ncbi:hypothetical protein [Enterococcus mediterraneensis]|nr:hypothetical protein [Enterococcus mediterraneensis]
MQKEWGSTSEDISSAVVFAIDMLGWMSVSNIVVRPKTQEV